MRPFCLLAGVLLCIGVLTQVSTPNTSASTRLQTVTIEHSHPALRWGENIDAPTTTTTSTSTIPPALVRHFTPRASRSTPVTVAVASVPATGCMAHGRKSIAQSEACWGALVHGPADHPYAWNFDQVFKVMDCESGGDPWDVNPRSGAAGLMQLHPAPPGAFDPATNIALAYQKWQAGGWRPWACPA